ncbi:MAG TPA: EamA family transporter RarD [Opitutaceae bacterium]|nr:EamA family transporter RarD [Opitutaceae bacterium]
MMKPRPPSSPTSRGIAQATIAYVIWGLFPLFWRPLHAIAASELIAHRIVWSLVFVAAVAVALGGWAEIRPALRSPRILLLHAASGVLLTVNWLTYVWGINHDRVLEASLGYFLVPLGQVSMGLLFLGERLHARQWWALGLATVGVALQFRGVGGMPWVALTLAASWVLYGFLRKRSALGSLAGLTVETALLTPVAAAYLLLLAVQGGGALGHATAWEQVGVLSAGIVTAVPLLLFAAGARRLPLTTIGLLQYLVPSLNFLLGAFLYREPLTPARLLSFAFIWAALALYSAEMWRQRRT